MLRFEAIRAEFLGDKSSWKELDEADWRKVGDGDDACYFEAVEDFFRHLYGAIYRQISHLEVRGELARTSGNSNGHRISLN